jgi:phosphatidylglycerol lysyltransferase
MAPFMRKPSGLPSRCAHSRKHWIRHLESPHREINARPRFDLSRIRHYFGPVWLVFLVAVIVVYIATRWSELEDIGTVIAGIDPRWIVLSGILELLLLVLMAKMYQSLFGSLGHNVPLYSILSAYLRGLAAATVIPFGGPVSVIIFTRAMTRRDVPMNDALYASALASLSGFASFLIVMAPLLSLLSFTRTLPSIFLVATLVLAGLFAITIGVVAVVLRWGRTPKWLARRVPNQIGGFIRQARSHQLTARQMSRPLLLSIGVDLCGALMLYTALVAVGQRSGILAAFTAYQVEMLFNVVTPLFQGIGITDLSITVALNGLGISVSSAATATLVYRVWDLWVPLLVGAALHFASRRRAGS